MSPRSLKAAASIVALSTVPAVLGQSTTSAPTASSNVVSIPKLDFISTSSATLHASVIHADESETAYALECIGAKTDARGDREKYPCGIMGDATLTVNPSRIALNRRLDVSSVLTRTEGVLEGPFTTVLSTYIGVSSAEVDCTVTIKSMTSQDIVYPAATCSGGMTNSFDIFVSTVGGEDGQTEGTTTLEPDLSEIGTFGIPVSTLWPLDWTATGVYVPVTITAGLDKLQATPTNSGGTSTSSAGAAYGAPLVTQAAVLAAGMAAVVGGYAAIMA